MRRVYLNCAGEAERDDTCVEYNRLMCLPGYEAGVCRALSRHLRRSAWDELILAGMDEQPDLELLHEGASNVRATPKSSWYIDLGALRSAGAMYESTLSANTRQQIRRSMRLYEESYGPLATALVDDGTEIYRCLDELAALHQKRWTERNEPGVFSSKRFREFHRCLIERLLPMRQAHIVRVTSGDRVVGLLYNFLSGGRVYFYQSGFAYQQDARMKPGLVCHYLAVNHYLRNCPDALEYDFLAGDSQYKRSLAKGERTLTWTVVQQPTFRAASVEFLRQLRQKLKSA